MGAPLLELRNICKRFGDTRALRDVSHTLQPGRILALVGENGAGKSTLMKILSGVYQPDSGSVLLDGQAVRLRDPRDARQRGISIIHQEFSLVPHLDVTDNLFLGRESTNRFGLSRRSAMRREAQRVLDRLGATFSVDSIVARLGIAQQQFVEIAKALLGETRVLIMDEPTSSLSTRESERLFEVIRDLKDSGVSIIYISHRLAEVQALSDRVTVLRDGCNAGELVRGDISHDRLVQLMVGRDISRFYSRTPHPPGDVVIDVQDLVTSTWPQCRNSFQVRAGEIVGIAGLVGAGRTEMLQTLFGVEQPLSGTLKVNGRIVQLKNPRDAIAAGVALVPEDRKQQGVVLEMAIRENIGLASLHHHDTMGFLNFGVEREQSRDMCQRLRVKAPSDQQLVQNLSGGNQQKVVLGKWLALKPTVLLLDEPTRGIDVGAKQEIYQLMDQLAGEGMCILFVSSEMEEIIGMSDRVIVMHEGRITGEPGRTELTEETVMRLATGG
ncbi:MAG: sugar ABC transporter ATP-binding protein [Planctomycetaceae bacterium]|nr:sugar ABC transporter ATP-binding protein [Planctomycetaceae bacterium]